MKAGLVSIVVPVYNAAAYLKDCIESVVNQTDPGWELLLVNDGSTDQSELICKSYSERFEQILLFNQENKGVSCARNLGICKAEGEFLCFLDADDRLEPNYLERLKSILQDADMAVCGVDRYDEPPLKAEVVSLEKIKRHPSVYAKNGYLNYSVNRLYRMRIIQQDSLRMSETMRRAEDACFVMDYLHHCKKIAVTGEILYHYRQVDSSATHRFYEGVCRDEELLMDRQYGFFHELPLDEQEESSYLIWEHGKAMSVLRYIAQYAPNQKMRAQYFRDAFTISRLAFICKNPPRELGPKSKLYAAASRIHCFGLLAWLVKVIQ